eukprot:TRINITY_DN8512_c0_g1_i1.p1 TRINITY_DN8512_c0_g1~~TRINITY_DN8512_c0_g1_i1.p1  ORF type:complete len:670 (-),score=172.90 TRINITY_DN8512_c0_g1_i1:288-2297(-)
MVSAAGCFFILLALANGLRLEGLDDESSHANQSVNDGELRGGAMLLLDSVGQAAEDVSAAARLTLMRAKRGVASASEAVTSYRGNLSWPIVNLVQRAQELLSNATEHASVAVQEAEEAARLAFVKPKHEVPVHEVSSMAVTHEQDDAVHLATRARGLAKETRDILAQSKSGTFSEKWDVIMAALDTSLAAKLLSRQAEGSARKWSLLSTNARRRPKSEVGEAIMKESVVRTDTTGDSADLVQTAQSEVVEATDSVATAANSYLRVVLEEAANSKAGAIAAADAAEEAAKMVGFAATSAQEAMFSSATEAAKEAKGTAVEAANLALASTEKAEEHATYADVAFKALSPPEPQAKSFGVEFQQELAKVKASVLDLRNAAKDASGRAKRTSENVTKVLTTVTAAILKGSDEANMQAHTAASEAEKFAKETESLSEHAKHAADVANRGGNAQASAKEASGAAAAAERLSHDAQVAAEQARVAASAAATSHEKGEAAEASKAARAAAKFRQLASQCAEGAAKMVAKAVAASAAAEAVDLAKAALKRTGASAGAGSNVSVHAEEIVNATKARNSSAAVKVSLSEEEFEEADDNVARVFDIGMLAERAKKAQEMLDQAAAQARNAQQEAAKANAEAKVKWQLAEQAHAAAGASKRASDLASAAANATVKDAEEPTK